jgi:hypothetical protein
MMTTWSPIPPGSNDWSLVVKGIPVVLVTEAELELLTEDGRTIIIADESDQNWTDVTNDATTWTEAA